MLTGIENLATGFLQGLNARKQQERQDVIDQREAERFDMQKQNNALSMKTNQFNLENSQKQALRQDKDYDRAKLLQEEADKFHKNMQGYFAKEAAGDYTGFYGSLEKDRIASGIKGQFLRDKNGNIVIDLNGGAIWTDGTLNGRVAHTPDSALEEYYNAFNPEEAIKARIAARTDNAKSERDFDQKKQIVGLQAAKALTLARENNEAQDRRLSKQLASQEKIAGIRAGNKTSNNKDFEPLLPLAKQFFGEIKSEQLRTKVEQQTKAEFINDANTTFNTKNVGKYINRKDRKAVEDAINQLADSLYPNQTTVSMDNSQQVISRLGTALPAPTGLTTPTEFDDLDLGE